MDHPYRSISLQTNQTTSITEEHIMSRIFDNTFELCLISAFFIQMFCISI